MNTGNHVAGNHIAPEGGKPISFTPKAQPKLYTCDCCGTAAVIVIKEQGVARCLKCKTTNTLI